MQVFSRRVRSPRWLMPATFVLGLLASAFSVPARPAIAASNASVTVTAGQTATNTGIWSDTNAGDTVTLSASIGTVTKAGTNRLRGSGWYNAKRDAWVDNDYVRKRTNQAKPLYRVNISGFSLGGPVVIPHVIDSRTSQRKVFFFGSQEFTRDARPTQSATAMC